MDSYFDNMQNLVENINEKFKKLNIPEDDIRNYMNTAYDKMQEFLNNRIMPNKDKIV